MLADPCTSTLIPGIFGDSEGLLARVKTTFTNEAPATATCGYILWSPDYASPGINTGVGTACNVLGWSAVSPATRPVNTTLSPLGIVSTPFDATGGYTTSGGLADPASALMSSDIVADARTIGACISLTYTGTAINSGGQYCVLGNIPSAVLLEEDSNNVPAASSASVDELFKLATTYGRLGIEPIEVVNRPDDASNIFRSEEEHVFQSDVGPAFTTVQAKTIQPQWFGIAWRGLPTSTASPMVFDLVKSIEWRAEVSSGFTATPRRTLHSQTQVHKATKLLDTTQPGWTDHGKIAARSVLRFANSATGRSLGRGAAMIAANAYGGPMAGAFVGAMTGRQTKSKGNYIKPW